MVQTAHLQLTLLDLQIRHHLRIVAAYLSSMNARLSRGG